MILGIKGWAPNEWLNAEGPGGEKNGLLLYRTIINHKTPEDLNEEGEQRLVSLVSVWEDYHRIFGGNAPLKRARTGPKDWDINFDGVAHYGLLPDLLQDMTNVGLETPDLSPLFNSGDDFAAMWTRCLRASVAFKPCVMNLKFRHIQGAPGQSKIEVEWDDFDANIELESSEDLALQNSWQQATPTSERIDGTKRVWTLSTDGGSRFYRLKRKL